MREEEQRAARNSGFLKNRVVNRFRDGEKIFKNRRHGNKDVDIDRFGERVKTLVDNFVEDE